MKEKILGLLAFLIVGVLFSAVFNPPKKLEEVSIVDESKIQEGREYLRQRALEAIRKGSNEN